MKPVSLLSLEVFKQQQGSPCRRPSGDYVSCGGGMLLITMTLKIPPDAKNLWSINKPLKFCQL